MLNLTLERQNGAALKVLCLGAHSDDIEIGCGGTILRWLNEYPSTEVYWIVMGASGERTAEAVQSADVFLENARKKEIVVKAFRDGYFSHMGAEIKDFFEDLKRKYVPDVILTHYREDLHQDHRFVSELTWNTFRSHLILEYEIVKYEGDLGSPNCFVHLAETVVQRKIRTILECFQSQKDKSWFSEDAFSSILRLRGIECRAPSGFAEAFHGRKLVF
jgi:LmbE family N-acetylglucosaminyl deacetylase